MGPWGKQSNGLITQKKMLRSVITLFFEKGFKNPAAKLCL